MPVLMQFFLIFSGIDFRMPFDELSNKKQNENVEDTSKSLPSVTVPSEETLVAANEEMLMKNAEVCEEDEADEDAKQWLQNLGVNSKRLRSLTNDSASSYVNLYFNYLNQ